MHVRTDAELLAGADQLRAEARQLMAAADVPGAFARLGPVQVIGSYVSDLMVWRDLDAMLTAPVATASGVLDAAARLAAGGRLLGVDFRDERGPRRPTPALTDERYYLVCSYHGPAGVWKIDITVWLHAVDRPHLAYAEHLATDLSPAQRLTILRIKDFWHRQPTYPDQVSGMDVYTAVVDDAVGTTGEFAAWLAARGRPGPVEP